MAFVPLVTAVVVVVVVVVPLPSLLLLGYAADSDMDETVVAVDVVLSCDERAGRCAPAAWRIAATAATAASADCTTKRAETGLEEALLALVLMLASAESEQMCART